MKIRGAVVALVAIALCMPAHATRYPTLTPKLQRAIAVHCFMQHFFGRRCKLLEEK